MVLEGVVSTLLNEYLGAFIEGLDRHQLQLNVWSGRVHLRSLSIKPSALDALQLPVSVVSGSVESLRLEANWLQLTSQPVRVELEGVHLLLAPRTSASPEAEVDAAEAVQAALQSKLRSLSALEDFRLQAEAEAAKSSSSTTRYVQRLRDTIIDNLQLSIRDVHVRYQDNGVEADGQGHHRRFTVGVGLQELSVVSTNASWERHFTAGGAISYRLVQLTNLFAYTKDEEEPEGQGGASCPSTSSRASPRLSDVLESPSTRFLLSPLSASLQMVHRKEEAASPRLSFTSSCRSIALSLSQRQFRVAVQLLSSLSSAHRLLESSRASSPSVSQAVERALSREERRRYVQLYKRTLNALWMAELSAEEAAELSSMELMASFSSLSQARSFAWFELKRELQGRTVMTRQAGREEAAKRSGGGGLLKGWFGQRQSQAAHEELTEQQREDLYALLEEEEKEGEGGGAGGGAGVGGFSHPPEWLLVQLQLSLHAISISLLDADYRPMLTLAAEGGEARVAKRERGMMVEVGLQRLHCEEHMLPGSHYAALMDAQTQTETTSSPAASPSPASSSSSPSPSPSPPFLSASYEDAPLELSDCDRRLRLRVSSPLVQLHAPLLSALLAFFSLPSAVDLAPFSAWSMQQLDALRAYSTATLADALSMHSAVDLNLDLTAPIIVVPLDPRNPSSDVIVLNLGHLQLSTELRDKAEVRDTLRTLRQRQAEEGGDVDADTRARLFDLYHVVISRTSVLLSAQGPHWRLDPSPSYLLEPLDLRLDVQSAISKDVNWLPNFQLHGSLEQLQLHLSNRKLRRATRFLDAFAQLQQLHPALTVSLLPVERWTERQLPTRPTIAAATSSASASLPSTPTPTDAVSSSSSSPSPSSVMDVDDLTLLFRGDRVKARAVLAELDVDGSGEVDSAEVVAWERQRLLSRAHKQLLQLTFGVQLIQVSLERERESGVAAGAGVSEVELLLTAEVSGVSVRLLKETFISRLSLQVGQVSAKEMSSTAPPRLLLHTAEPDRPARAFEGVRGQVAAPDADADAQQQPAAAAAPSPPPAGFVWVDVVHTPIESPSFSPHRVESRVDVSVGQLHLLIDMASAFRLGSFLLFDLLPAAARSASPPSASATVAGRHSGRLLADRRSSSSSHRASSSPTAAVRPSSAASSVVVPSPLSPLSSPSSPPSGRAHTTRLSLRAAFSRLRISVCVGSTDVSEVDVRGLQAELLLFRHSLDLSSHLHSITVRDCTPDGRVYPEVITSRASSSPSTSPPSPSTALISLTYRTFSRQDEAPPPHWAALTARLRGLQFIALARFVDEQLAMLRTGPIAALLSEKQRRDAVEAAQRRAPRAAPPPSGVTERRRSSLATALLSPASLDVEEEDDGASVSPFSARHLLLVDVGLEDVSLLVPYHSSSSHHIAASFASITASNELVDAAAAGAVGGAAAVAAGAQPPLTRLSVGFSAFTVRSVLQVGQQRREATIVDLSSLQLRIDSDEAAKSLSVQVQPDDVVMAISPAQLQLLLALPTANVKERGNTVKQLLQQSAHPTAHSTAATPATPSAPSPSARSSNVGGGAGVGVLVASPSPRPRPSSPRSPTSVSASLTVLVSVTLPTIRLDLFDDQPPPAAPAPHRHQEGRARKRQTRKKGEGQTEGGDDGRTSLWLLSLSIRGVAASLALHPDGSLQAELGVQSVLVTDRSTEGQSVGGRAVLEQRKRIIAIEAPPSSHPFTPSTSSASPVSPLQLTIVRTVDANSGALRSVVEMSLSDFRFSVAAVLLRLRAFAPPTSSPRAQPQLPSGISVVRGAVKEDDAGSSSLALIPQHASASSASASARPAAASPSSAQPSALSSLSLRVRMIRPTFQLVADPTAVVSPALLLSWSAVVEVERSEEGGRERLQVSGALQRLTCAVTELRADEGESESAATSSATAAPFARYRYNGEAAIILPPFNAALQLTQFSGPPNLLAAASPSSSSPSSLPASLLLLPRRSVSLSVEPILLRLSYSSYRLLSNTLDLLTQQQDSERGREGKAAEAGGSEGPGEVSSRLLQLDDAEAADDDEGEGEEQGQQAVAVVSSMSSSSSDEFGVTDTQLEEASPWLSLFAEDDCVARLPSVQVLLINDCLASELPFARLSMGQWTTELHSIAHHRNVRSSAQLTVDVFDNGLAAWTPLLEPYTISAALTSSIALAQQSTEVGAGPSAALGGGSDAEGSGLRVRGVLCHWLQVHSSQALNVNLSHSLLLGCLDALHVFEKAEKARKCSGGASEAREVGAIKASPAMSPSSTLSLSRRRTDVGAEASDDFLPFRIDNCTELALQLHGLYAVREHSASTAAPSSSSTEFGPWSVPAQSSLPFSFPPDASPVNQALIIQLQSSSPSSPPFPALTVPFTRTAVLCHRLPGRSGAASAVVGDGGGSARLSGVVVVTEMFISNGVKVCRVRGGVGVSNRTEVAFEWKGDGGRCRGWPALAPHSTFFFPLFTQPQLSSLRLQLRPQLGGFDFCAPFSLSPALSEETVARFSCARTGQPAPSTSPAFDFSGDLHAVLSGESLTDALHLHGPVEEEVRRSRATRRGQRGGSKGQGPSADGDGEGGEDEGSPSSSRPFDVRQVHSTVYSLRPPVVVENLLPCTAHLRCVERTRERPELVRSQQVLEKGHRLALFSPSPSTLSSLSFRLPSLHQSQWSPTVPLLGDGAAIERALSSAVLNVVVRDDDKVELVVHAQLTLQQGCVVVSLYVPYWLFDETHVGLVVGVEQRRTVPLPSLEELQLSTLSDERRPLLFNFPPSKLNSPAEDRQVTLTTVAHLIDAQRGGGGGGVLWSKAFNVDAVGFRFSASIPGVPSRGADAVQSAYDVGVSIQQGTGLFRRTKMVVCAPRLVLVNALGVAVELRQHQTVTAIRIAKGGQEGWQWADGAQKRFLALRRVGNAELEGWEWSGLFNPARVGTVNVLVRHSTFPQRYWYLRVESRMQDSTCFCVLSAFPQEPVILRSVLPYRVHNRALFHSVRFRQCKEGVSYGDWIVVEPQTSAPFAWEQPLLAGEVEVQLGLKQSLVGERWEERFTASFDAAQAPPLLKKLKPLPGDETRAPQSLFVTNELYGPTRVLLISVFPSLEQSKEDIINKWKANAAAAGGGGGGAGGGGAGGPARLTRRALNAALRSRQQVYLQQAVDALDGQLSQLSVLKAKLEERLQGLASGMIERPTHVAPADSALVVGVLGLRGLPSGAEAAVSVAFNGSEAKTEAGRADERGQLRFTARSTAFRANNLRLSTACRVSVTRLRGGGEGTLLGCLDFTLFEYDDHQPKTHFLPLFPPPSSSSSSSRSALPLPVEVELSVWWIPPAEEEVRRSLASLHAVEAEWRRVKAAVKAELKRVVRGRLEGVVGSANTEVQFLVRVTGLTGVAELASALPDVGGRVVVRVSSDLTGKVASALLYQHDSNIRLALLSTAAAATSAKLPSSASPPPPPPSVVWGHSLPFLVSEDVLDSRGGEVLHFDFFFAPAVATSDCAPAPSIALAQTSIPLNALPISRPEAKPSPEEAVWTQRSIPLQPLFTRTGHSAASSSSSAPSSAAADLSMTATFRRFVARSDEQRAELKASINLPSLSVSLIDDAPEELLLLTVRTLSLDVEQGTALQTLYLRLDHAQLDHQRPSAIFPVVLAPSYVPPEVRQPLVQLSVTKQRGLRDSAGARARYAVWSFPYLSLLVQSLDVRLEEGLVWALVSLANTLTQRGAEDAATRDVDSDVGRATVRRVSSDVRLAADSGGVSGRLLYFQLLQIQPLAFRLSFLARPGMRAHASDLLYNPFQLLLSAASTTLGSIDNAAIQLDGQTIENASGTVDVLLSSLRLFYQDAALRQAYKLVGSFDFLGNPSELLSNLGTGLSAFFFEPAKGLVKSPSDFGRGVAKGFVVVGEGYDGWVVGRCWEDHWQYGQGRCVSVDGRRVRA